MAVDKQGNEIKIIAWHLVAKNLVKFTDSDKSYKLTDKILAANDFVKFPLSKGDKVEVSIEEGVVTFLKQQKSETKIMNGSEEAYEPTPEELDEAPKITKSSFPKNQELPAPTPKVEAPKVEGTTSTVLTVFAVAANKKVVKFLEVKDAGWYQISPEIQAQDYATIGLIAKNKVQVTFNDKTVTSLVKVASEPAEQPKTATSSPANAKTEPTAAPAAQAPVQASTAKKEWKPQFQSKDDYWMNKFEHDKAHFDVKESEKQLSIEAQAAVNSANEVAGKVAASISPVPTANVINNMIRAIAESNFALIQELKKK